MHGARERNTIRWDARRTLLQGEIERLQAELDQVRLDPARRDTLHRQLEDAQRRMRAIGPSPRAKMG
jgi:hypothetical protein